MIDEHSQNPRLQCERCGRWMRLYNRHHCQLLFPLYEYEGMSKPEGFVLEREWDYLCVKCHLAIGYIDESTYLEWIGEK